jgi:ankyrin repeat protein
MGADPNLFSNNESPLMIAAQRNNIQIVELLVEYRASTRDCNANKLNALDIAILYGNYTIALYLVKDHKMMVLKDANLYRKIARERGIDYFVDYVKMLDCLSKQLDDLSIPDLFDESNAG